MRIANFAKTPLGRFHPYKSYVHVGHTQVCNPFQFDTSRASSLSAGADLRFRTNSAIETPVGRFYPSWSYTLIEHHYDYPPSKSHISRIIPGHAGADPMRNTFFTTKAPKGRFYPYCHIVHVGHTLLCHPFDSDTTRTFFLDAITILVFPTNSANSKPPRADFTHQGHTHI